MKLYKSMVYWSGYNKLQFMYWRASIMKCSFRICGDDNFDMQTVQLFVIF